MLEPAHQFELPPAVRRALDAARRRLRAYVWLEGVAVLAVVLGAAFWLGLALDWLLEPSPAVRSVGLIAIAVAALYVGYRYLLRRVFVPVSDASLALLLERRFPKLRDHVLTSVHVAARPGRADRYHPELVAQTQYEAVRAIADVDPRRLFRRGPLLRTTVAALALGVSVVVLAIAGRDVFGFYLQRLALSPEPWPRQVHLEVVGFPPDADGNRAHKLAQDDDFELLVHARTNGYQAPDEVEIRYRLADGRRGRDTMIRVGEAQPGRDEYQVFRYEFRRVASDMTFDIVGGDDRVRDLQLRVVDRPQLFSIELACVYPEYLGREPRRLPVTGGMRIPEGANLVLSARSTKPLASARIALASNSQEARLELLGQPSELTWDYGTLMADDVLLITVTDADGVSNRDPYRVSLAVVPDELPQVAVRLAGIGTAVTPEAVIPLVGRITDEYGLDRAWFEYQVDDGPVGVRPLARQPTGELAVNELDRFDLRATDASTGERALRLEAGQKLKLALKATDRYDLAEVPRDGSSQQFLLDVVTEAELLALIERRELELRQRYEAIYERVSDTRDLLGRIDFQDAPAEEVEEAGEAQAAAARALARRRLRVSGAQQNIVQSADETLAVAEGFDEIHDQLTNNRIDNPDLQSRLREEISLPLHAIGGRRMPELSAGLKLVEEHVEDAEAGPRELAAAVALADDILTDMRQVLDRMLELETYNEVVALLRGIIADQEELNRRTRDRQRDRLRSLLED